MSARPTTADVLRVIRHDDDMRDAAHAAAVLAMGTWESRDTAPPAGWIGGQVRNVLPEWLDDAMGTGETRPDEDIDPTGEIGAAFYPTRRGMVHGRAALDALPDGAFIVDRDGYVLVKESWTHRDGAGRVTRVGSDYRVLYSPDSPERGAVFGADELVGDHAEPGSGSAFLPGVAYTLGGRA